MKTVGQTNGQTDRWICCGQLWTRALMCEPLYAESRVKSMAYTSAKGNQLRNAAVLKHGLRVSWHSQHD